MALSDKLYSLRKKRGLSQEQLAEQLNVSRQAISKWESGYSIPESDKLIAISTYFKVSLDYLMKEDNASSDNETPKEHENSIQPTNQSRWLVGIILSIGGIVCLIIWGLLSIFNSAVSNQISESSMITIDGNGILLILCIVAIVVGAGLLLKGSKKK